ncbi:MAG: hypothetical protein GXP31_12405 [Kiritimatiellaeota bacterium]|nr:hypothetical protein [Kiritimatiellota bacterium]
MQLSSAARDRLRGLLEAAGNGTRGFRVRSLLGTCSGSTPLIAPAAGPQVGETVVEAGGICFFVPGQYVQLLESATLDFDRSFLGRGLTLTWPHRPGCACTGLRGSAERPGVPARSDTGEPRERTG